ncbi:hypothetical protein ABBQ32_012827 [Trebouxia sp. C0010 RCD-2024]
MLWTDERLQQVIAQYTPVLYLHEEERYLPCSVDWYIKRSQLWLEEPVEHGAPRRTLLLDSGQVDAGKLLEVQQHHPHHQLRLEIEPLARPGMPQSELDEVPLYVVVKEVLNKEACVEAVEINYLTFYAFNGPYTIGVFPLAFEAGAHDGDWEHFTVRLDANAANMVGCYFHAHRPQDGQWLPADAMPKTESGQPIAYVAKGAHGLYTSPGVHRRAWCAVNDHCGDKGPVWRCKNCILMEPVMQVPSRGTNLQGTFQSATTPAPAKQLDVQVDLGGVDWLHFKGNFGSSAAPHAQGFWYFTAEHPVSRTWFQRVLWHCSPATQSLLDI